MLNISQRSDNRERLLVGWRISWWESAVDVFMLPSEKDSEPSLLVSTFELISSIISSYNKSQELVFIPDVCENCFSDDIGWSNIVLFSRTDINFFGQYYFIVILLFLMIEIIRWLIVKLRFRFIKWCYGVFVIFSTLPVYLFTFKFYC